MTQSTSLLPLLAASFLFISCDDTLEGANRDARDIEQAAAKASETASEDLKAAYKHGQEELQAFEKDANQRLEQADKKLTAWRKSTESSTQAAREAIAEQAKALDARREQLLKQTAELKTKAGKQLRDAQQEVEQSLDSLEADIDSALQGE